MWARSVSSLVWPSAGLGVFPEREGKVLVHFDGGVPQPGCVGNTECRLDSMEPRQYARKLQAQGRGAGLGKTPIQVKGDGILPVFQRSGKQPLLG